MALRSRSVQATIKACMWRYDSKELVLLRPYCGNGILIAQAPSARDVAWMFKNPQRLWRSVPCRHRPRIIKSSLHIPASRLESSRRLVQRSALQRCSFVLPRLQLAAGSIMSRTVGMYARGTHMQLDKGNILKLCIPILWTWVSSAVTRSRFNLHPSNRSPIRRA